MRFDVPQGGAVIDFKCKHCFTKYSVRPELAGRTAECKTCGRRFLVPYVSPVVRLGEDDIATAEEPADVSEPLAIAPDDRAKAPARAQRPEAYRAAAKRRTEGPPSSVLLPLPPIVADLWLPLGLLVLCLGLAVYLILDDILGRDGSTGGLVLIAFAVASLAGVGFRLAMRALESSAHTFDLTFSNAIALQAAACLSVPVLGGVVGLLSGGLIGTAVGAGLGLLLCPLLLTLICQLPPGRGLQAGLLASLMFGGGYVCSAVLVGAVANVMFNVWSVDLPWKQHPTAATVAAATQATPPAALPATITSPAPAPIATDSTAKPATVVASAALPPQAASAALPATRAPPDAVAVPPAIINSQPVVASSAVPGPAKPQPAIQSASQTPAVRPAPVLALPPAVASAAIPLHQAMDLLDQGKYADAAAMMKTFQDGLPKHLGRLTDPLLIDSLHIQAVAYMRLGQYPRATPPLQRLMQSGITERSVVINAAVCDILQKSYAMRAVKTLKPLVAAHPDDEEAITLWGVALDTAASHDKYLKLDDQANDYVKANAILEQQRPGKHHWGTSWVSGMEWSSIDSQRSAATSNINFAKQQLSEANTRLANAQDAYDRANVIVLGRNISDYEADQIAFRKQSAAAEIDRCRVRVTSAQSSLERANADMPRPNWAYDVQPVRPQLASDQ